MKKIAMLLVALSSFLCAVHSQITCTDGTILFREDFGGNSPDAPLYSTTPLAQCTYTFAANGDPRDSGGVGRYAIRKESWNHNQWYYPIDDHTSPNDLTRGYLMQIDASATPGQFYKTQINNLCPGSSLTFSVWGMSSTKTSGWANGKISLVIEKTDGTEITRLNVELVNQRGYWEQFAVPFNLPAGETSVVFRIINNSNTSAGNDFMLDDIEIRLCTPPVTVSLTPDTACVGTSATLAGTFTNDGTFSEPLEYRWLKSATGNLTSQADWLPVGGNSTTLNIPNVQPSDSGFYRLAVSSAGGIDLENCRAMSDPVFLAVKTDCPPAECPNGTILWKETFDYYDDGLNSASPIYSRVALPAGMTTYNFSDILPPATPPSPYVGIYNQGAYALIKHSVAWSDFYKDDHTYPNNPNKGRFMLTNGKSSPDKVYQQTITGLCSGSILNFSFWAIGVDGTLLWTVYAEPSNEVLATYTVQLPPPSAIHDVWVNYEFPFALPYGVSSIRYEVYNNCTLTTGNDVGYDDIEIRLCTPPVTVTPDTACVGTSATLAGTFTNDGTFSEPLEYRWLKSPTGNLTSQADWLPVGGNSATLNIPNVQPSDSGFYRLAVSSAGGGIDLENCRAMSEPVFLAVDMNCLVQECPNGTILFKEDFGGNNPSDPDIKASGIPQVIGYTYSQTLYGAALYVIAKQNPVAHSTWYMLDDHTYPNDPTRGYMMAVDASVAPGQFYECRIDNLCEGNNLYFSSWIASLIKSTTGHPDKANLLFVLEDLGGNILRQYATGNIPDADPNWKQYGFNFSVPAGATSVILKIINNATGSTGNDFVLDDIEIRLCTPPVTVTPDTACVGTSATLAGTFTNDGTFSEPLEYRWLKSATGNLTSQADWLPVGGNSATLNIPNVQPSDSGFYRLAVSSAGGGIDLENCRAMSEPVFLAVDMNCPQSTISCTQAYYPTDDTEVFYYSDGINNDVTHNGYALQSMIWRFNGTPGIGRFYVKFDLSDNNNTGNTVIKNTDLYLYSHPTFEGHSSNKTNKHVFNRVTSDWNETTLVWNNQPSADEATSVITNHIPGEIVTPDRTDYTFNLNDILLENGNLHTDYYGIMCRPYSENVNDMYRRITFASKEYGDNAKNPTLKVEYEFPEPTIEFQCSKTFNVANNEDLKTLFDNVQYLWTINGTEYVGDTIKVALSENYTANLHIKITNNIGEVCDYYLQKDTSIFILKDTIKTEICAGDSIKFNEKYYKTAGLFTDTLQTAQGCDSLVTLNLILHSADTTIINDSIFAGNDYNKNGFSIPVQNTVGSLSDTLKLQNQTNCDSLVILNLKINAIPPPIVIDIVDTVRMRACDLFAGLLKGLNYYSHQITQLPQLPGASLEIDVSGNLIYLLPNADNTMQYDEIKYEIYDIYIYSVTQRIFITPCHIAPMGTDYEEANYCAENTCHYEGPSILINEVMINPLYYDGAIYGYQCSPSTQAGGEWIELYNPNSCEPVDISGYFMANSTVDYPYSCYGNPYTVRNIGAAFVLPEGTVIPPNGFCVLRGERAAVVDSARLIQNGGNTVVINLVEHFDRFCLNNAGNRFWLPNVGGWFGFYDRKGIAQDAVYWGDPLTDICTDCTPCNPLIAGTYAGTLASLDSIAADRKTRITDFTLSDSGNTPKRIPDGAAWRVNEVTPPTQGTCNDACAHRINSKCNGTATVTVEKSGSYSYLWNDPNGQTTPTATGLCEGTYCCTVTDNTTHLSEVICVTVTATVNPIYKDTIRKTITEGDSILFNGAYRKTTGIYDQQSSSIYGCDSITVLDLQVEPLIVPPLPCKPYYNYIHKEITEGEKYIFNGQELSTEGIYSEKFVAENGCDSVIMLYLGVLPKITCPEIEIPLFFTPNGDGWNDFWKIKNIDCYRYKIILYDRFSKELFVWENNFPIEGWNGMYLGKPLPSTDYWYLIVLTDIGRDFVGHFTLLR
ncbi:MAG: T9SS type B sorting domain-containing protein [Prevotellaceae bacterium]|jgi:gliding motility-associated-like protein|nr:T9SS type B sorting domain-containing protein [Prevotellaceae bacterium]